MNRILAMALPLAGVLTWSPAYPADPSGSASPATNLAAPPNVIKNVAPSSVTTPPSGVVGTPAGGGLTLGGTGAANAAPPATPSVGVKAITMPPTPAGVSPSRETAIGETATPLNPPASLLGAPASRQKDGAGTSPSATRLAPPLGITPAPLDDEEQAGGAPGLGTGAASRRSAGSGASGAAARTAIPTAAPTGARGGADSLLRNELGDGGGGSSRASGAGSFTGAKAGGEARLPGEGSGFQSGGSTGASAGTEARASGSPKYDSESGVFVYGDGTRVRGRDPSGTPGKVNAKGDIEYSDGTRVSHNTETGTTTYHHPDGRTTHVGANGETVTFGGRDKDSTIEPGRPKTDTPRYNADSDSFEYGDGTRLRGTDPNGERGRINEKGDVYYSDGTFVTYDSADGVMTMHHPDGSMTVQDRRSGVEVNFGARGSTYEAGGDKKDGGGSGGSNTASRGGSSTGTDSSGKKSSTSASSSSDKKADKPETDKSSTDTASKDKPDKADKADDTKKSQPREDSPTGGTGPSLTAGIPIISPDNPGGGDREEGGSGGSGGCGPSSQPGRAPDGTPTGCGGGNAGAQGLTAGQPRGPSVTDHLPSEKGGSPSLGPLVQPGRGDAQGVITARDPGSLPTLFDPRVTNPGEQ